jgi:S1-C subfamily serine protease
MRFLLFILLGSGLCAGEPIVMVKAGAGPGSWGHGTGCVIWVGTRKCKEKGFEEYTDCLVLTAMHVVADVKSVLVVHENGKEVGAAVYKRGDVILRDVATLLTWAPPGTAPLEVTSVSPSRGEPLRILGLGGLTSKWPVSREIRDYKGVRIGRNDRLRIDAFPIRGDSGGPILDSLGRVVGVVSGGSEPFDARGETWPLLSIETTEMVKIIEGK